MDLDAAALLRKLPAGMASSSSGGDSTDGGVGLQPLLSGFMGRVEGGKKHMGGMGTGASR